MARTTVTRALMSCVKPTRIIAQSRSGSVIWSPLRKTVIKVSSNERVSARRAPVTMADMSCGNTMYRNVWKFGRPKVGRGFHERAW